MQNKPKAYRTITNIKIIIRKNRKIFYKYKKDEKEQQIEVINEFYVLNHSYKTKDKVKEELRHTENTADSNKTHYNYEFWNLPEIPKLSMPLELFLKNKME